MERLRPIDTAGAVAPTPGRDIAVVVLTHNRAHLLRQCVENVLLRTSPATREIVVWDNASSDETAGWDAILLDAFLRLPRIGFLAADLVDDPHDEASHVRHHVRPHEYTRIEENGVRLLRGPTGGGCAMTSRELNQRVGGFREKKAVFWLEDQTYIGDIAKLGFEAAVLADLKVHHTGGPYYAGTTPEKEAFWAAYWRMRARRTAVKRVLFALPLFGRLNARFGWCTDPRRDSRG